MTAARTAAPVVRASPPLPLLVHAAFLLSGFTSLVLEVIWSKELTLRLGSTLHAMSTVVAVYLGGLAVGAYVAGRLARRCRRPLLIYGLLEAGIGLYALASLSLLEMLEPVVAAAYAAGDSGFAVYAAVRAAFCAAVLVPPTLMMGATLPLLVTWATGRGAMFGRSLARLYALNTLGAVAGVSAAGFYLVPRLGLVGATRSVGVLAAALGAALIVIGARQRLDGKETIAERAAPRRAAGSRAPVAVLLVGASGAVALALEIAWARIFGLIFGSSVYSFSLVLAAYLLGIALGSALWGGRLAEGRRPWLAFAFLQGGAAAGIALGLWILPRLPGIFMTLLIGARERLGLVYAGQAMLAGLVVLVPCLAFGALFPVGARLLGGTALDGGRATGVAYAVNTCGTVAGALLAGFLILPRVGVHAALVGAALFALLLGLAAWLAAPVEERRGERGPSGAREGRALGAMALAATIGLGGLALTAPRWDEGLFTLGVYRYPGSAEPGAGASRTAREAIRQTLDREQILFYREGLHSVVSVHGYRDRPEKLTLRVNGKPDAGTGEDMPTQILLGHLPMLWAPPESRVCVIGLGAGVTVRAVLAHDPASVTVVEIEPAVVEAARLFDAVNERALDDPRVEMVQEDGRTHLQHSGRRYDMIVSEPSNPWISGVNNLFTTDFYRLVRAARSDRGVFCQWVQYYALSRQAMGSLLRSFAEVFPDGEAFLLDSDLLLIAPPDGVRVSGERLLAESFALEPRAAYLARFGLHADGRVAAYHIGGVAWVAGRFPPAPLNTDDRPYVEYRAPFDLYRVAAGERLERWDDLAEPEPLAGLARWVAEEDLSLVARAAGVELARIGRAPRAVAVAEALSRRGARDAARAVSDAVVHAAAASELAGPLGEARRALEIDDLGGVEERTKRILAEDPGQPEAHLLAGEAAMRRGALGLARRHLERVLPRGDSSQRALAHNNLGIVDMREGRVVEGRAAFDAARRTQPGDPTSYLNLARWHLRAGDAASARRWLEEGLARAYPAGPLEQALRGLDDEPS